MNKTHLSTKNIEREQKITPSQCKAARNLLNWNQQELAEKSRISVATIGAFESGSRIPYPKTLEDIEETFKKAGVEFEETEKFSLIKVNK